jgi:hypothetical protein
MANACHFREEKASLESYAQYHQNSRVRGMPFSYISLVINIYFLFCRTNSVRDLIFVCFRTWSTRVVWESTTCGSQRDISLLVNISLVINIYFLFCRTNSVRDLIFRLILYMVNYGRVGKCIMRKSKRYLFSILPNQQRARFDYLCGQPWSREKAQYAGVKKDIPTERTRDLPTPPPNHRLGVVVANVFSCAGGPL